MSKQVKRFFRVCFIIVVLLLVVCAHNLSASHRTSTLPTDRFLLIDPGHGGEDGGASSADGTLEKAINLAIA